MRGVVQLVALGLLLTASGPCCALEPDSRVSQLGHTAWRIRDGAFSGAVNAVSQTADGYLWIGTDNGLLRYDGVRFLPAGDGMITTLEASPDGSLWVGTSQSIRHMKHGQSERIEGPRSHVNAIRLDNQGTVWFTRSRISPGEGALCEVLGKAMHCFTAVDGIPLPYAEALAVDKNGDIWVADSTHLLHGRPGAFRTYPHPELDSAEASTGIESLTPRPDGSLLVGIARTGPGLGLQSLSDNIWRDAYTSTSSNSLWSVTATLIDRDGTVWVGTADQGIFRIRPDGIDHFGETEGLSGNSVSSLYEDREGDVWVGTKRGLDRFRNLFVRTFSTSEGLAGDYVDSVASSKNGGVWIGNRGSLSFLKNGQVTNYLKKDGLPGQRVTSLMEDHTGRLWVGVDTDLYVFSQGRFTRILDHHKRSSGVVVGIVEDTQQNIFVLVSGRPYRLLRFDSASKSLESVSLHSDPNVMAANPDGGLFLDLGNSRNALILDDQGRIEPWSPHTIIRRNNFAFSRDGSKWASTARGIEYFNQRDSWFLDTTNGLPCAHIHSIILDHNENLWAYASCGLVFVASAELSRFKADPKYSVTSRLFDVLDGALPNIADFSSLVAISTDGDLWFANGTEVQVVDPTHSRTEIPPPPVQIEAIVARHVEHKAVQGIDLAPLTEDVDLRYTAPSLSVPERLQFRYRLDGHDKEWQDITKLRDAFYTDLGPGHYMFRVVASNADGVWSTKEATLSFTILPAWYQTKSFILGCIAACSLAIVMAYRLRIRTVRRDAQARYDERLAERTRIARDMHDTLLQTIQGSKMLADTALAQLNEQDEVKPRLQMLSTWLGNAMEEGRAALRSLRAPVIEQQTIESLLQDAVDDCALSGTMETSFELIGEPIAMSVCVREEIYRIGFEAINNGCLHSGGTNLKVQIVYAEDFQLRISDDGNGVDTKTLKEGRSGHFGLAGMRERARFLNAELAFTSSQGIGTEVSLTVPNSVLMENARPSKWSRLQRFVRGG